MEPELAAGSVGWPQLGSLTVDAVVGYRALGGLAGHIHDGAWGPTSNHATGHDLEWQWGCEAQLASPASSHSCPEGSSPGTPG